MVGAALLMLKSAERSWALFASLAVVLGALVNLHWIAPFLQFLDSVAEVPVLGHFPGGPGVLVARAFSWTYGLANVVSLVGLAGLASFARERGSMAAACSAAGAAALFFLGTVGFSLPLLKTIEPGRFLDGIAFFLLPPAADAIYRWLSGRKDRIALAVGILLIVAYPSLRSWARLVGPDGRGALVAWDEDRHDDALPTDVTELVQLLRSVTTPQARIMIEDADHLGKNQHAYGYTHLPALFPHLIGRELIGGPMEDSRLAHHFVDFTSGRAFTREIDDFGDDELGAYLDLYNVGWIVAWSDASRRNLDRRPFVRRLRTVGKYVVFEVDSVRSFGLGQPGIRVHAEPDKITVEGAGRERTVLKYHCMPGLRTEPPLPLACTEALDDPIGFIAVDNGKTADFVVLFDP